MIETVSSIYTGDHGKGKFRFGTKLVVRTKDTNDLKKFSLVYPLADVKCKTLERSSKRLFMTI